MHSTSNASWNSSCIYDTHDRRSQHGCCTAAFTCHKQTQQEREGEGDQKAGASFLAKKAREASSRSASRLQWVGLALDAVEHDVDGFLGLLKYHLFSYPQHLSTLYKGQEWYCHVAATDRELVF
eukprot:scpid24555/ scgid9180/ 